MSNKTPLEPYTPDLNLLAARLVDGPLLVVERARRLGVGSCPCSDCRRQRS